MCKTVFVTKPLLKVTFPFPGEAGTAKCEWGKLAQPRVSKEKLVEPGVSEGKLVQPSVSEEKSWYSHV